MISFLRRARAPLVLPAGLVLVALGLVGIFEPGLLGTKAAKWVELASIPLITLGAVTTAIALLARMPRVGAFLRRFRAALTLGLVMGLGLVIVGLGFSIAWLWVGIVGSTPQWIEPASVVPTALGVVVTTLTLLMRKSTDTLRVAHGLAVGYYFNFVSLVCEALANPESNLHGDRPEADVFALIVAIPDSAKEIERENLYKIAGLDGADGLRERLKGFDVDEVSIDGGPGRKTRAKLVLNPRTKKGVLVDIPTTLSVIADYANYLCEMGAEKPDQDYAVAAKKRSLTVQGSDDFREHILDRGHREFPNEVVEVASPTSDRSLPHHRLRIVDLSKLKEATAVLVGTP